MDTETPFIEYNLHEWINKDNLKWVLLAETLTPFVCWKKSR